MPLHHKDIKKERQWRATIGLSSAKFYFLGDLFSILWLPVSSGAAALYIGHPFFSAPS